MKRPWSILLLLLSGCAWGDGRGFAHLSGAIESEFLGFDPAAGRIQDDGWIRSNNSFEFDVTQFDLALSAVRVKPSQVGWCMGKLLSGSTVCWCAG